jgi:hypothetical protein
MCVELILSKGTCIGDKGNSSVLIMLDTSNALKQQGRYYFSFLYQLQAFCTGWAAPVELEYQQSALPVAQGVNPAEPQLHGHIHHCDLGMPLGQIQHHADVRDIQFTAQWEHARHPGVAVEQLLLHILLVLHVHLLLLICRVHHGLPSIHAAD